MAERDTATRIVRGVVASQCAGVRASVVGDGRTSIRANHLCVEADQPLPGGIGTAASDTVRRVAGGATETSVDMPPVLGKAGVLDDVGEVVTLPAQRIRTVRAEVGSREQVGDQLTRRGSLAEFIAAFEDVVPLRSMGADGAGASEFAVVVAVVAIGAENASSHRAGLNLAADIPHGRQQAGLRDTGSVPHNRMNRDCRGAELRDEVQGIAHNPRARWQVSVLRENLLAGAIAVAAQASFELPGGWPGETGTVRGDAGRSILRRTNVGRGAKCHHLIGGMGVVAIGAGRVAILIQNDGFPGGMRIAPDREGVALLGEFGENVRDRLKECIAAVVANDTALARVVDVRDGRDGVVQQANAASVVRRVTGQTCELCHGRVSAQP